MSSFCPLGEVVFFFFLWDLTPMEVVLIIHFYYYHLFFSRLGGAHSLACSICSALSIYWFSLSSPSLPLSLYLFLHCLVLVGSDIKSHQFDVYWEGKEQSRDLGG